MILRNHFRKAMIYLVIIRIFMTCSTIMDSMLYRRNTTYNFRNLQKFQSEREFFFYGLEILSYHAPQLWTLFLEEIRQRNTISPFKSDIRHWICRVSLQIVQSVKTSGGTAPSNFKSRFCQFGPSNTPPYFIEY